MIKKIETSSRNIGDIRIMAQRSYNMSQVKSKNTKPELIIFELLKSSGLKYRKHYKTYGEPDKSVSKIIKFVEKHSLVN